MHTNMNAVRTFARLILRSPDRTGIWVRLPDHPCAEGLLAGRQKTFAASGPGLEPWIAEAEAAGWGVFLTLHAMGGRSRRLDANCSAVRVLCVDGDSGGLPTDWGPLPRPHLVHARSAEKWAAFWRLAEPDGPEEAEAGKAAWGGLQRALALHYGGDPQVIDLARVMRVSGTLNWKDPIEAERYDILEEHLDAPDLDWRAVAEALGLDPDHVPAVRAEGSRVAALVPEGQMSDRDRGVLLAALRQLIERYGAGTSGASRHGALLGWVGDAVASGMGDEEAGSLVRDALAACGREETPGEVERMLAAARRGAADGTWTVGLPLDAGLAAEFSGEPPDVPEELARIACDRPSHIVTAAVTPETGAEAQAPMVYTREASLERRRAATGAMLSVDAPANADELLACDWRDPTTGEPTLLRWQEQDYRWDGLVWRQMGAEDLDIWVQRRCAGRGLTQSCIKSTTVALRRLAGFAGDALELPCWIDWEHRGRQARRVDDVVAFRNGILDIGAWVDDPRTTVRASTPALFSLGACGYDWDGSAQCPRWHQFLREIWPSKRAYDAQAPVLQEWLGYLMSADNRLHGWLCIQGRPRSGKSTIQAVLEALVGVHRRTCSSLSHLAGRFGLASVHGRSVLIVPDSNEHQDRRDAALGTAIDRLKAISGGDTVVVERKNREDVVCRLGARLVMVSNRVPTLLDPSGAMFRRMSLLSCDRYFGRPGDGRWRRGDGRRDPELLQALYRELPGIAVWALEGLRRLRDQGHFSRNTQSEDLAEAMEAQGAPVAAWADESLEVVTDDEEDVQAHSVPFSDVLASYRGWCAAGGRKPMGRDRLVMEVRALFPGVRVSRPRRQDGFDVQENDTRPRMLLGAKLTPEGVKYMSPSDF